MGLENELIVLVRFFPGLEIHAKSVQALATHLEEYELHLIKVDTFQLVLSKTLGQHMQAHLTFKVLVKVNPSLECSSQSIRVLPPHHFSTALNA